jgi:hypothetical protein
MKRTIQGLLIAGLLATAFDARGLAQLVPPSPPPPPPTQAKTLTPLQVEVVISRYEGDKKVSSLPYILAVTADEGRPVSLRMGSQIPVPQAQGGVNYSHVGTNIDCKATSTNDGRFKLEINIQDSSIMERRTADLVPTLRNFSITNVAVLRDGQTAQFTAAADRTTGEVVKVDVTLKVEK